MTSSICVRPFPDVLCDLTFCSGCCPSCIPVSLTSVYRCSSVAAAYSSSPVSCLSANLSVTIDQLAYPFPSGVFYLGDADGERSFFSAWFFRFLACFQQKVGRGFLQSSLLAQLAIGTWSGLGTGMCWLRCQRHCVMQNSCCLCASCGKQARADAVEVPAGPHRYYTIPMNTAF